MQAALPLPVRPLRLPDFSHEMRLPAPVAGIDEAGRGPWAGPVVAAAVILSPDCVPEGIADSKQLSAPRREVLLEAILRDAQCGIGVATVEEIDQHNILQATFLAMQRAVANLPIAPAAALVDGNRAPLLPCAVHTLVKGDQHSFSVAAASIVAKVTRDRIMADLGRTYPEYGFERHAGYGTRQHQDALARFGVTPHHRRSYAPIRALISARADIASSAA